VTSLFPPGAGGEPKGPIREPLHPDEKSGTRFAPRPPSERPDEKQARRGVGLFRFAGWGWGFTIALALFVGAVVLVGYLRDDPGRNPVPAGYVTGVCGASEELREGTRALQRGVEAADSPSARISAAIDIEGHVRAANVALTDLPLWEPGRSLDELIGSQLIALTNGALTVRDGLAAEDLEIALQIDANLEEQLSDGRYGFDCSG
jgi:hypothetical protein